MNVVGVLINLPTNQLNSSFTYYVPESLSDQVSFGKRVLVDFAGKKTEGYVIEEMACSSIEGIKPLLRVLDQEPVFDQNLLALAKWMAEYYTASLALVLAMMIPNLLHRPKGKKLIAGIEPDRYYKLYENKDLPHEELFKQLWVGGQLSLKETLLYISQEEMNQLLTDGLLLITGVYKETRTFKTDYVYVPNEFDPEKDLDTIRRRAPRQAEAMELLLSRQYMDQDMFGQIFTRATIKALLKKGYIKIERQQNPLIKPDFTLNDEQKAAIQQIQMAIRTGQNAEFLLFGVTGSGKTEVYLNAAQTCIDAGQSVIVLVPEIALTRQLVDVFSHRIANIAVLHSGMPAGERHNEWKRIKRGEARLVLGPRSAIFAPVPNLGLIIIDEEQESTYKQEEQPRYHAREVARERARLESAILLLGSATPAIETYHRTMTGSIKLLPLNKRTAGATMPRVIIEDMRNSFKSGYRGLISSNLQDRLAHCLRKGEQSILFINRRGYSPMTVCRECGTIATCPNCSVGMSYHRDLDQNICHYCNYHSQQRNICSVCSSTHLQLLGSGTQKVEEEVRQLFPAARVERLDMDSSRHKGAQKSILTAMKNQEIDILIGTQMVAKGLDFANVSLVGIVDADSILNLPDFRAGERCFQLLVQAAGRAGRANIPGDVVIQTYNPDAPVIQLAASQDYRSFYREENRLRRMLKYPPYTELLRIVFNSSIEKQCLDYSLATANFIEEMIDAKEDDIMLLGPAPCPISKIKNRYRYQIIIKCTSNLLLRSIAVNIIKRTDPADLKLELDLNPMITM